MEELEIVKVSVTGAFGVPGENDYEKVMKACVLITHTLSTRVICLYIVY